MLGLCKSHKRLWQFSWGCDPMVVTTDIRGYHFVLIYTCINLNKNSRLSNLNIGKLGKTSYAQICSICWLWAFFPSGPKGFDSNAKTTINIENKKKEYICTTAS